MCTAATYKTEDFYFGRNLDYEFSYGDEVTVTPRAYPFALRCMGNFRTKYAMIGMAAPPWPRPARCWKRQTSSIFHSVTSCPWPSCIG